MIICLPLLASMVILDPGEHLHPQAPDKAVTKTRTVTQLAPGVYTIRHPDAPDTFPQSNTTVVIGSREVLVVDSCYMPSSAAEDIADIRRWTNKPVRYLVNTHWHYDHTMGNGVYAAAFPGLKIVAHTETRNQCVGYNPGWFARFPTRKDRFQKIVDEGKASDGTPLTEADIADYKQAIAGMDLVQAEFAKLVDRTPNVTFDKGMRVDLGGRIVEIKHLGRGNTAGDAIVYLPAEKILITGDLVDHPVPYLGGGFPSEQIQTLRRLANLDARIIVPGHGMVLRDKAFIRDVASFIEVIVNAVSRAVHKLGNSSTNLPDIQREVDSTIDLAYWRKRFCGDDPDNLNFFNSFSYPGVVRASHAETWRR